MGDTTTSRPISDEALDGLWRSYRASGDRAIRDRLVLTLSPLVNHLVRLSHIDGPCEVEDLVFAGLEALIRAIDRYEDGRPATLTQFAWSEIQAALHAELPVHDGVVRPPRRSEHVALAARERMTVTRGAGPSTVELAETLASTVAAVGQRMHAGADAATPPPLEASAPERHDPQRHHELIEAKQRFRDAFASLPERDRQVAMMHCVEGLTLREIGELLGVTESRISRIEAHVRHELRVALADDAPVLSTLA